jgi:hypothetical protein
MTKQANPNSKKTVREYYANNALGYVCHICKVMGGTLYRIGWDKKKHKVYACEAHRETR